MKYSKNTFMRRACIAALILLGGASVMTACSSNPSHPNEEEQNYSAQRITDVLNYDYPPKDWEFSPDLPWLNELQNDYGAPEGCKYERKTNKVLSVVDSGQDLASKEDIKGHEKWSAPTAVEKVTLDLMCGTNKTKTLDVTYLVTWDTSSMNYVLDTVKVDSDDS